MGEYFVLLCCDLIGVIVWNFYVFIWVMWLGFYLDDFLVYWWVGKRIGVVYWKV